MTPAAESFDARDLPLWGPPAAVVPHAPLLVPELCPEGFERQTKDVREAVATLPWRDTELVVLLSPHGERSGVLQRVSGSLAGFGIPGVEGEWVSPPGPAAKLAADWGVPLLERGADHGVLVPLLLGAAAGRPVLAATLAEATRLNGGLEPALSDARRLGPCLRRLGDRVGFVASVNSSAALAARAPFGEQRAALEMEDQTLDAMQTDVGRLDALAPQLFEIGRSCGAAPLACLATLRRGSRARLCAYERPAGVGYPVAFVD